MGMRNFPFKLLFLDDRFITFLVSKCRRIQVPQAKPPSDSSGTESQLPKSLKFMAPPPIPCSTDQEHNLEEDDTSHQVKLLLKKPNVSVNVTSCLKSLRARSRMMLDPDYISYMKEK
eukprot:scaffold1522_cov39-Attheya_sp.AAC.4